MECNKWQEEGLLYISKELNADGMQNFQKHIEICSECRAEADQYRYEAEKFFNRSLLSELPSEAIDNKIIAMCSQPVKVTTGLGLFSGLWLKKAVFSTMFLVFGMSAGVYFTVNYLTSSPSKAIVSSFKKPAPAQSADNAAGAIALAKTNDSSSMRRKDSLKRTDPAPIIRAAHLVPQSQGIITVDLKKE